VCAVSTRYIQKNQGRGAESGVGINFNVINNGSQQLQVHSVLPDGEVQRHTRPSARCQALATSPPHRPHPRVAAQVLQREQGPFSQETSSWLSTVLDSEIACPAAASAHASHPAARAFENGGFNTHKHDSDVPIPGKNVYSILDQAEIFRLVRGAAGSTVKLSFRRGSQVVKVNLIRSAVPASFTGCRSSLEVCMPESLLVLGWLLKATPSDVI